MARALLCKGRDAQISQVENFVRRLLLPLLPLDLRQQYRTYHKFFQENAFLLNSSFLPHNLDNSLILTSDLSNYPGE